MQLAVVWRPFAILAVLVVTACGEAETTSGSEDRIRLDTLALLVDEGSEGGVFADFTPTVRRGPGRRLTAMTRNWTKLAIFDEGGGLVRLVGTPGDGPGEFGAASPPLELPDGRLLVHDIRRRRLIEFDPELTFLREHVVEGIIPLFVTDDGLLVASGFVSSPDAVGQPAHLLDLEGVRVASFGSETGDYRADRAPEFSKRAAPGPGGHVWLAPATPYRVELWDPRANRLLRVIEPSVEWFEPRKGPIDLATEPPPSRVTGIWQEEDGPLWVVVRRASRRWQPPEVEQQGSEFPMTAELQAELYEVVVHALDPDSGEIIAELYVDGNLRHFPPGPVLVGRPEVVDGTVTVPVMVPKLLLAEEG